MRKIKITIIISIILGFNLSISARKYNLEDAEAIMTFLSVYERNHYNYEALGVGEVAFFRYLQLKDERVFDTMKGIIWSDSPTDKRVIGIAWEGLVFYGTFSTEGFSELESLSLKNTTISSVNLKGANKLKTIDISDSNTGISWDFAGNPELESIEASNSRLRKIIFSGNDKLLKLNCSGARIVDLDISGAPNLKRLDVSNVKLIYNDPFFTISLKDNKNIEYLDCSNSLVKKLDFPSDTKIKTLKAANNIIDEIHLPQNLQMDELDVSGNLLYFSKLPIVNAKIFKCSANIEFSKLNKTYDIIDLSSEYMLRDKTSTFEWSINENITINMISDQRGKFRMPYGYDGDDSNLFCIITNANYPNNSIKIKVLVPEPLADTYDEHELKALQNFLKYESNYFFFNSTGLTKDELLKQNLSTSTIRKITGVTWTKTLPRKIKRIDWNDEKYKRLKGELNIDSFSELDSLSVIAYECTYTIKDNQQLKYIALGDIKTFNGLTISNLPQLQEFKCKKTGIYKLNLQSFPLLKNIDIDSGEIKSLILPKSHKIETLKIANNMMRFSTLPLPSTISKEYVYAPQAEIDGVTVYMNDIIDLSEEYMIDGTETNFEWTYLSKPIAIKSLGGGKFTSTEKLAGMDLVCKITNTKFPKLTLTYKVKVTGKSLEMYDSGDLETLKDFLLQSTPFSTMNYAKLGLTNNDMREWGPEIVEKIAGVKWTDTYPKRITTISWDDRGVGGTLDCSKWTQLKYLGIHSNYLTMLDISKNPLIKWLDCKDNNINDLRVNNKTLTSLDCRRNKLTVLDVSQNVDLEDLDCIANEITELKLKNNTKLKSLMCHYNKLTLLELPASVEKLNCTYNNLTFSTLPKKSFTSFLYTPQEDIVGNNIKPNEVVDLSKEFVVDGENTLYEWYINVGSNYKGDKINVENKGNGRFIIGSAYLGKNVVCKMANLKYPGLVLSYKATVSGTSDVVEDLDDTNMQVKLVSNIVKDSEPLTIINNRYTKGKVYVYDLQGRVIYKGYPLEEYETKLYLYNPGAYIMKIVMSDHTQYNFKILKY